MFPIRQSTAHSRAPSACNATFMQMSAWSIGTQQHAPHQPETSVIDRLIGRKIIRSYMRHSYPDLPCNARSALVAARKFVLQGHPIPLALAVAVQSWPIFVFHRRGVGTFERCPHLLMQGLILLRPHRRSLQYIKNG